MAEKKKKLRFTKALFNGSFIYNPVLTQSIGICTIVAVGTTLKISLVFSAILFALLFVMEIISSLILKHFSRWMRVSTYMLISTFLLLPLIIYIEKKYSSISAAMGLYLPLLAVNSLIVIRCEAHAVNSKLRDSIFDAIASGLGFFVVSVLVGTIREIIAYGTVFGKSVPNRMPKFSGMALPFGGLLVLGFLAAFHKWIVLKKFPRYPSNIFNLRTAFDTPALKNEGILATSGTLSLMRDPTPLERSDVTDSSIFDDAEIKKPTVLFENDTDDDDDADDISFPSLSERTTDSDEKEQIADSGDVIEDVRFDIDELLKGGDEK